MSNGILSCSGCENPELRFGNPTNVAHLLLPFAGPDGHQPKYEVNYHKGACLSLVWQDGTTALGVKQQDLATLLVL